MSDKKNLVHNSKKEFLSKEVEHIDITSFDSRKIISSMEKCLSCQEKQPMLQTFIMKC